MQKIDRIATAIVLLLGVGHVVVTPRYAPVFTQGAAWFSGSGLTLVLVAFLNLSRYASPEVSRWLRGLCLVANVLTLAWLIFVTAMVPVPQAFLAAAAVLIITVTSVVGGRKSAVVAP